MNDIPSDGTKRVAIYKVDRDRQKALTSGNKKREVTYETKEELKAPSRKELNDIIYDQLKNQNMLDTIFSESMAEEKRWLTNPVSDDRDKAKKRMDSWKLESTSYDAMVKSMSDNLMNLPQLRDLVITELKKRGYNSMVDEGNVRASAQNNQRRGYDPFVVFDPDKNLQQTKEKKITKGATKRATKRYEKWSNRANWGFIKDRTTW